MLHSTNQVAETLFSFTALLTRGIWLQRRLVFGSKFENAWGVHEPCLVSPERFTPLNSTLLPSLSVSQPFFAPDNMTGWACLGDQIKAWRAHEINQEAARLQSVTLYAGCYCQARAGIDLPTFTAAHQYVRDVPARRDD